MKLSIKHSSFILSLSLLFNSMVIALSQIPTINQHIPENWFVSFWPQIAVLSSIILLGLSLFIHQEQIPRLSISLRVQAAVILVALVCSAIHFYNSSHYHFYSYHMDYYLYTTRILRMLLNASLAVWFMQYAFMPTKQVLSRSRLNYVGLVAMLWATVVLVLILTSGLHILFTERVAGYGTTYSTPWVLHAISLIFFSAYAIDEIIAAKRAPIQSTSSETTISTPSESSKQIVDQPVFSKTCKVIAWISVVSIFAGIVTIILCDMYLRRYHISHVTFPLAIVAYILCIINVINMLKQQNKKWVYTLNMIARIFIRIMLVVLILLCFSVIEGEVYRATINTCFIIPIFVWAINSAIVILSSTSLFKRKQQTINNHLHE